ncbi:hypothetical protein SAMN05421823_104401 [Catalinimonas alkaloidigena]|uniref:Uncharacterized protein n=1 Tax=Catalinimonas alkaloidigena TaxID=1075417 RepID=A0A1G9HES9_9BACT|nr:hypothetical protein [Catalinimonas alkaloidigena]SDL10983.1 hypothetical protein SAMN05421823_104401 [Catalinimonas alkaloidigena]
MKKPIKRKEPDPNFDWDRWDRKKSNKKEKKAPRRWDDEDPPKDYIPDDPDPEVLREMENLTDEERALPYPDYFIADLNVMKRREGSAFLPNEPEDDGETAS